MHVDEAKLNCMPYACSGYVAPKEINQTVRHFNSHVANRLCKQKLIATWAMQCRI